MLIPCSYHPEMLRNLFLFKTKKIPVFAFCTEPSLQIVQVLAVPTSQKRMERLNPQVQNTDLTAAFQL